MTLFIALLCLGTASVQAAFIVNSTDDVDDGTCDVTHCSLREAILAANGVPGPDTINFNIPGEGPHTIQPLSGLPTITDPVVIDGYSQAGSSPNSLPDGNNAVLLIELDGSAAGPPVPTSPVGLGFRTANSTVRGLVVNRFACSGIAFGAGAGNVDGNVVEGNFIGTDVTGTLPLGNGTCGGDSGGVGFASNNNRIGGTTPAARNLISANSVGIVFNRSMGNRVQGNFIGTDVTGTQPLGNTGQGVAIIGSNNQIGGTAPGARNIISDNGIGISIAGADSTGNLVEGNFIGTDVSGTQPLGNNAGVRWFGVTNNIIGGTAPGAGNLISGNNLGVVVQDCCGGGNKVQGNFIGTKVTGTEPLGNNTGVLLSNTPDEIIGGTAPGAGNLISGNNLGVLINGSGATGHLVQGNYIGTDITGTQDLGNKTFGVFIFDASNNTIGGRDSDAANIIAFNERHGVLVASGVENGILSNDIFSNTLRGIDLGNNAVTLNDPGDGDSGANHLQNFPVLSFATTGSVEGTLHSTPNTDFTIQFFANEACDPSGFGEGETFLGSTSVTTDGFGDANFTGVFPVPLGQVITATATTDPDNNTSEFSCCDIEVESCDVEVETVEVAVDIHPTSCPNPLNVSGRGRGIVAVAILGTMEFDVTQVDPTSVRLEGVAPLRSSLEDVATPFELFRGKADLFDCTDLGPDGFQDLTLKFDRQELIAAIGEVNDGDVVVLQLTGSLNDGSGILGEDVVVILK